MTKEKAGASVSYDSEAKQRYRKEVWDALLEGEVSGGGVALIMPSKSGAELEYLIEKRHFPQSRIICIDDNPAIIASAKWRKKYKSVRAYGISVANIGKKLRQLGVEISYANLDMCNNFSESLVGEVRSFLSECPKAPYFNFAVTVSKGREQSVTNYLMNVIVGDTGFLSSGYEEIEEKRIACLMRLVWPEHSTDNILKRLKSGKYINNKTPMAWASFKIENIGRHPLMEKAMDEADFQRHLVSRGALGIEWILSSTKEQIARMPRKIKYNLDDELKKMGKEEGRKKLKEWIGVDGFKELFDSVNDEHIREVAVLTKILCKSYEKTCSLLSEIKDGAIDPPWCYRSCPVSEKIRNKSGGIDFRCMETVEYALKQYNLLSECAALKK